MQPLALAFLVTVAIGGLGWVFIYPILSGERRVEQRRENIARARASRAYRARRGGKSRRDQVEETLKEMDARHKATSAPPLTIRISQAGLTWSKQRFYLDVRRVGRRCLLGFHADRRWVLLPSLGVGFAAAFGLPFWILSFLKKRREAKFLNAFP